MNRKVLQSLSMLGLAALLQSSTAMADDKTTGEKVKSSANDVKRDVKKDANKVDEALCTGTDAECAAKKAKHRVGEAKDTVTDKVDEAKDQAKDKK